MFLSGVDFRPRFSHTAEIVRSPPNPYIEVPILKMMVLGKRAFRRWLHHGNRALMNGISACPWYTACWDGGEGAFLLLKDGSYPLVLGTKKLVQLQIKVIKVLTSSIIIIFTILISHFLCQLDLNWDLYNLSKVARIMRHHCTWDDWF
jgi:hypothetical protein